MDAVELRALDVATILWIGASVSYAPNAWPSWHRHWDSWPVEIEVAFSKV